MTQFEAIDYAKKYLHQDLVGDDAKVDIKFYKLHRKLQYQLCMAYARLLKNFEEVTRKDIAYIIESWILVNAGKPLVIDTSQPGWDSHSYEFAHIQTNNEETKCYNCY